MQEQEDGWGLGERVVSGFGSSHGKPYQGWISIHSRANLGDVGDTNMHLSD